VQGSDPSPRFEAAESLCFVDPENRLNYSESTPGHTVREPGNLLGFLLPLPSQTALQEIDIKGGFMFESPTESKKLVEILNRILETELARCFVIVFAFYEAAHSS
jgi:hypothetical protein